MLTFENLQAVLYALYRQRNEVDCVRATRGAIIGGHSLVLDPETGATLSRKNIGRVFLPALELLGCITEVNTDHYIRCRILSRFVDQQRFNERIDTLEVANGVSAIYDQLTQQIQEIRRAACH